MRSVVQTGCHGRAEYNIRACQECYKMNRSRQTFGWYLFVFLVWTIILLGMAYGNMLNLNDLQVKIDDHPENNPQRYP